MSADGEVVIVAGVGGVADAVQGAQAILVLNRPKCEIALLDARRGGLPLGRMPSGKFVAKTKVAGR